MSGGFFDYYDSRFSEYTEKLGIEIKYSKNRYTKETIKELQKCLKYMQLAELYMHHVDWLLSGDNGEESFHKYLAEDLTKLTKTPKIKPIIPKCKICKYFKNNKYSKRNKCTYRYGDEDTEPYLTDATECYGFCAETELD